MSSFWKSSLLRRIAVGLARPSGEVHLLDEQRVSYARFALFGVVVAAFGGIYFPSLNRAMGPQASVGPNVVFKPEAWRAVYLTSAESCGANAREHYGCLANPENPIIWTSAYGRSDPAHRERIQQRAGAEFWIGIEIDPATLRAAKELGANRLVLGWFNARYKVWLDGELYLDGDGWHESHPVVVPLSFEKLAALSSHRLAIQLINEGGTLDPDLLNEDGGGEGFYHVDRLNQYLLVANFESRGRPFGLFSTFLIMALMFFTFWLPSRQRPEYFYLSLYALACAFNQARQFDLFYSAINVKGYQLVAFVLISYEVATGMLLGLAVARTRRGILTLATVVGLVLPWLISLGAGSTAGIQELKQIARVWGAPVAYSIGAAACLVQAWLLQVNAGSAALGRKLQLLGFAVGLTFLGWIGNLGWGAGSTMLQHSFLGIEQFALLVFLGAIALRELKEQAQLARRTPVSEYHRRESLPERVTGALVVADYKPAPGSELRRSATENESAITVWRTHFYNAVLHAGGTIIHHKGKEVMAFFDNDRCEAPDLSAMKALEEVEAASKLMDIEFQRRRQAFCFRAAVALGSIRPIWEEVGGGAREPYWEEAGNSSSFVEAARLLEMQAQAIPPARAAEIGSIIALRAETADGLIRQTPRLLSRFFARRAEVSDKHGQRHLIAVYLPAGEQTVSVTTLARPAAQAA